MQLGWGRQELHDCGVEIMRIAHLEDLDGDGTVTVR
jgi:hypothetical protein